MFEIIKCKILCYTIFIGNDFLRALPTSLKELRITKKCKG